MSFKTLKNKLPTLGNGVIGIVAQEQSRYTKFWAAFTALIKSYPDIDVNFRVGNQLASARAEVIASAKAAKKDWVWFIDDDHDFKPDILIKLLSHNVDIVGPLYCIRGYPFDATARELSDDGTFRTIFNTPASGEPGLKEVLSTGTSGLLIRRKVWETMDRPWFGLGHLDPEQIAEDFFFCDKARQHGFKVYVDTSIPLEHFATMKVSQQYINNKWHIVIDCGRGYRVALNYEIKKSDKKGDVE